MKFTFKEHPLIINRKHLLIFILTINLVSFYSFGQDGYYSTDRTSSSGIKLVDGGDVINSKYCRVKTKDGIKNYSPYDVVE